MDAYETLISFSNAVPGSDTWTHLNSLQSGGSLIISEGEFIGEEITMDDVTEIITDSSEEIITIDQAENQSNDELVVVSSKEQITEA